jgi:hypothetical protein
MIFSTSLCSTRACRSHTLDIFGFSVFFLKIELIIFLVELVSLGKLQDSKVFVPGFYIACISKMLYSALTVFFGQQTTDMQ